MSRTLWCSKRLNSIYRQIRLGASVLAVCLAAAIPSRAVDAIGKASATVIGCPSGGVANGKCYRLTISGCFGPTKFYAGVKLNPARGGTRVGAVLLTTGGGGNTWYDNDPKFEVAGNCGGNCGLHAVVDLNAAGYETLQTNFSDPTIPQRNSPDGSPIWRQFQTDRVNLHAATLRWRTGLGPRC